MTAQTEKYQLNKTKRYIDIKPHQKSFKKRLNCSKNDELEAYYLAASKEIDLAFDVTTGDGLESEIENWHVN